MPDLIGRENVDRIAILVSCNGTAKFLAAPKIQSGTGANIADVVHTTLLDWNISEKVVAASFDTTLTNTGPDNGACVLLNELLGRNLINLACRHHVYELLPKSVFEIKFGATSAPEPPIFKRFEKEWSTIKQKQFSHGLEDSIVRRFISDEDSNQIKQFCRNQLQHKQIRGDYQELLELAITFVGGDGGNFHPCGATSHARFMSKGIYCLKIFLFRAHFKFYEKEFAGTRAICIFFVKLYIKVWFECTNAVQCPNQDLNLLRDLFLYAEIDKAVSNALVNKFKNHLWYLSPDTVGLAFCDPRVSVEIKRKMVARLKSKKPLVTLVNNRKYENPKQLLEYDLSHFVSYKTKSLFSNFELQTDFFELDPSEWVNSDEYNTASEFFQNLFVVNDSAERGVKFMKDYNRILARDEEEWQLVLQAADRYRQKYPSYTKSALTGDHHSS